MSGPLAPPCRSCAARRSPTATTAAAPSPNIAVPTSPDTVGLTVGNVSEQSSTDTVTATPSGAPRRTGRTAQAEQRHPAHIQAQANTSGDAGIQRRHRDTGDGRGDDHVDVFGLQPGLVKSAQQRFAAKVNRVFDEDLVRLAEVGQRRVLLE